MSCWDDIDDNNYVEYRATANGDWQPSGFCETCVSYLLKTQWDLYTSALAKTTCKAEQRRLLKAGPPVNLKDAKALPCPDEGEVHSLWFKSDSAEHSAKLEGSLTGEVWYAVMRKSFVNSFVLWYLRRSVKSSGTTSGSSMPRTSLKKRPPPLQRKLPLQTRPAVRNAVAFGCEKLVIN
jgi:hypothetical protein